MPPASGAGRFPNLNDRAEGPARYAPPDHLLFVQAGTLFAQRFDVNTLQVGGEPVPIAENVGRVTDQCEVARIRGRHHRLPSRIGRPAAVRMVRWNTRTLVRAIGGSSMLSVAGFQAASSPGFAPFFQVQTRSTHILRARCRSSGLCDRRKPTQGGVRTHLCRAQSVPATLPIACRSIGRPVSASIRLAFHQSGLS
jgi:hypothetical protein